MRQWIRSHLTYANVTTTILLFLVLGSGGAYALTGSNTVFSDDLANGQVKTADLADNAVNTAKVGDRTLKGIDLHARSVGTAELAKLPAVDARRNTDLALNPSTSDLVTFDAESVDTADMHSGSGYLIRAP